MSGQVLLIPHISVHNANAFSSPFTIGFPAMTAWLGAAHALQRKLQQENVEVQFSGVGIVSHQFDLQTYQGPGDYVQSIIGSGNPLEPKAQKGKPKGNAVRSSFVEEARCHLEVSLVIQFSSIEAHQENDFLASVSQILSSRMKLAGGDILEFQSPEIVREPKHLWPKLMPGYALIERRELMQEAMNQGLDALDALLDYLAIHHSCVKEEVKGGEDKIIWQSKRRANGLDEKAGWIVPIATGFQGVSDLGAALNQRDANTPHRFAESVVTLGEFIMPYRLTSLDELLWYYKLEPEENLYLCVQHTETAEVDY